VHLQEAWCDYQQVPDSEEEETDYALGAVLETAIAFALIVALVCTFLFLLEQATAQASAHWQRTGREAAP
jgi:hypothetical protein